MYLLADLFEMVYNPLKPPHLAILDRKKIISSNVALNAIWYILEPDKHE